MGADQPELALAGAGPVQQADERPEARRVEQRHVGQVDDQRRGGGVERLEVLAEAPHRVDVELAPEGDQRQVVPGLGGDLQAHLRDGTRRPVAAHIAALLDAQDVGGDVLEVGAADEARHRPRPFITVAVMVSASSPRRRAAGRSRPRPGRCSGGRWCRVAKVASPAAASPAASPPSPPSPSSGAVAPPSAGGAVTKLPSESVCAALLATVGEPAGVWASSSLLSTQPAATPRAATSATSESRPEPAHDHPRSMVGPRESIWGAGRKTTRRGASFRGADVPSLSWRAGPRYPGRVEVAARRCPRVAGRMEAGVLGGLNPARWLSRLASVAAVELPAALDEIAERIQEVFDVDVVEVHVADESDPEDVTRGYCVGPSPAAQALAPLLTPDGLDPIGLGDAAVEADGPVVWPRIVSEPAEIERLARLADEGGPAGALHRLMLDASGIAVPLGTPHQPGLGAVALVSLTRESPVPESHVEDLLALAPQIALTVRNHQLDARTRRTRQTLEEVISSSRMGVLVSDLRGRLSLANQAAADILGIDLEPWWAVRCASSWRSGSSGGSPTRTTTASGCWRSTATRPAPRSTTPRRSTGGRSSTRRRRCATPRGARGPGRHPHRRDARAERLAEARRLAAERAELLRAGGAARAGGGRARAGRPHDGLGLTPSDIHDHLLDQTHRLTPACHKSARPRGRPARARRARRDPRLRRRDHQADGLQGRRGRGGRGAGRPAPVRLQRRRGRAAHLEPHHRARGIRSFMNVPLVLGDRVYGLLTVNSAEVRAFGERDLRVVGELARHAASALQNALQFEQERHIAETLQQALIAEELPALDGPGLAALYQAAAGSQVGGDFYSACPSASKALLWATCRARASRRPARPPWCGTWPRRSASTAASRRPSYRSSTRSCTRASRRRPRHAGPGRARHRRGDPRLVQRRPPAAGAGGRGRRADPARGPGPPCGAFEWAFTGHEVPFPTGGVLVLYTDGILEARRDGREFGEEGLSEVLRDALWRGPRRHRPLGLRGRPHLVRGRLTDDVAIAVARRVATAG